MSKIVINTRGEVLDGNHRVSAALAVGIPISSDMVRVEDAAPVDFATGDKTYQARLEKWAYIQRRLGEKPKPTYDQIGKELGISKQNVGRFVARGGVKPAGQPRSNAGRVKRLRARLHGWNSVLLRKQAEGRTTDREQEWVNRLTKELESFGEVL